MPKRPDAYYRPQSLKEALDLLQKPDTVPLGGGTKLLAGNITSPVVDLQALGLAQIEQEDDQLRLGATTKLADWANFLKAHEPPGPSALLQKAIHQAGPNTYRNAATPGGIVASRLADSELLAALLALEVSLTLYTPGEMIMSLADYLAAPERPPGLITHLNVPWHPGRWASHRVARTPADTPIVSVTYWQPEEGMPRLAATGLDERPVRLADAEAALSGGINEQTIAAAAIAAKAACRHPGDFRGDAAYRAEMATVLCRRTLQ